MAAKEWKVYIPTVYEFLEIEAHINTFNTEFQPTDCHNSSNELSKQESSETLEADISILHSLVSNNRINEHLQWEKWSETQIWTCVCIWPTFSTIVGIQIPLPHETHLRVSKCILLIMLTHHQTGM
jgi:hypothetical protein